MVSQSHDHLKKKSAKLQLSKNDLAARGSLPTSAALHGSMDGKKLQRLVQVD